MSRPKNVAVSAVLVALLLAGGWALFSGPAPRKTTASTAPSAAEPPGPGPRREQPAHIVSQPAPSASIGVSHRIALAPWGGAAANQVGRSRPAEGNPEAPMSLVAAGADQFLVLDQVNQRVTRWSRDGKATVLLSLKGDQAADVAVGPSGSVAVLDRLVGKEVALFDKDGRPTGSLPLDRERVGDPGAVTGVFIDGDDVYVERAHGPLLRLGSMQGAPSDDRSEVPGRPSRDGKLLLSAGTVNRKQGRVYVSAVDRATSEVRFTRQLNYAGIIASIVTLDSDKTGTIYLAVALDQGAATPTMVTCLEPAKGTPLGAVEIPTNDSPEETMKEITVTDDGSIVFAHRLEEGMAFESYRCP